ncbi:hypothetical protein L0P88_17480 [Muricauda sp. SCSIO 64092]|uniref:hypothetical protein n=1 Tax=Allomuricauda sp. SCSIO 64092 TaxID=2908842 RepID=UPI001FF147F2|nr:hypothetical protein [Muricauda sp. SCSIO 64092]UOY05728.1 hypothetical protein L0P88_17480 [Muricauda sp. SCSIO 64092]
MEQLILKAGAKVTFDEMGYRYTHETNEYGDREVEDFHFQSYGIVLLIVGSSSLVWLWKEINESLIDTNCVVLDEMKVEWLANNRLSPINDSGDIRIIF